MRAPRLDASANIGGAYAGCPNLRLLLVTEVKSHAIPLGEGGVSVKNG